MPPEPDHRPGDPTGPGDPDVPARPPVSWPLVFGLGALALLWPLTRLTGLAGTLGTPGTALLVLGTIALTWIGVAGLGRVPRPVLTLVLAGAVHGAVLVVQSHTLGWPGAGADGALAAVAAVAEVGRSVLFGLLAGLAARGLRRAREGGR
ncbi:hypothetical protein B0I33_10190 [Prauserella shujinwangii]|uniref:Uncharacterized protein n=1 Tax=Prauserella shujinwangii TaxID=1453103 RepID=A0A2T0M2K3_9PSEU|nr:hypothetical protein [Prauserella shujinwangii]PRX50939.1 hypothetical protein B0I33_10190 [Prauserella shujinwangii]